MINGQFAMETALKLTPEEAEFINENLCLPVVKTLCSLLRIQSNAYDPGGYAMLETAMEKVRELI